MKYKDLNSCPICKSTDIKEHKKYKECNSCNARFGIEKYKLWYEYTIHVDDIKINY